ncbi:MAG: ATP-binding cassette domain-containing protein [Treponema sp.]|nr:ATP-binding cassette domain-containing protein [Treponema sp.]
MPAIIEVEHFIRRYGDFTAVDDISFSVEKGTIFGFLGPNGAGKSTTINTLCTILEKTEGTMRVNGHDIDREKGRVRKDIGIVFQDSTLDARLSVQENLHYHCEFYGVPQDSEQERIDTVLNLVELTDWKDTPVQGLSGGMKRRAEIARALVHEPAVLFLDEPTSGLDPQARAAVWKYIRRVQQEHGTTIFLTTHYMDEAETCDEICIMNRGKIAAAGTPTELKEQFSRPVLELQTWDPEELVLFLKNRNISFSRTEESFCIQPGNTETELEIISQFKDNIVSFSADNGSLDDVFLTICGTGTPVHATKVLKEA